MPASLWRTFILLIKFATSLIKREIWTMVMVIWILPCFPAKNNVLTTKIEIFFEIIGSLRIM